MTLHSPLTALPGIGKALASKYAVLGLHTVSDLFDYYPRRYEDYSEVTPIAGLQPGAVTIKAAISGVSGRYVRRGMHITEAIATDESGSIRLVWFNQPYRANALRSGQAYFISGPFELRRGRFSIANPSIEAVSDLPQQTARILAVYRETKGLTSRQIRQAVHAARDCFAQIRETLPTEIIQPYNLLSHAQALEALHLPQSSEALAAARRRIGFEEVLELSLASLLNRQENQSETAVAVPMNEVVAKQFVTSLPFQLTDGQRRAVWQAYTDMDRDQPMNRLVEGDVGSGKTVVAAMAALAVLADGGQVALMAPTELLARQHAETLYRLLDAIGYGDKVALLVGSMNTAQKRAARTSIRDGRAGFMVGTQALIQETVDMHKLRLVIIDEQHRFGVDQRKTLMAKAGHMPHVLSMTATPIPRSLALTLYGELDISVLAEKPAGRLPIETSLVSPNSRAQMNGQIESQLTQGRQMFVVCPLISESDVLQASSAEATYERFRTRDFKQWRIGLLHGKLPAAEKQAVMERFVRHELDIIVSTTVIEVGVDVPNASVMLIESGDRFGLAQLHQLRGRVGRGSSQAYCFVTLSDSAAPSRRLRAFETMGDGFKLAELDLELRGPGAIYGTAQHGQLDLRIAKLSDVQLIADARQAAQALLDNRQTLLQLETLMQRVNRLRAVTNLN